MSEPFVTIMVESAIEAGDFFPLTGRILEKRTHGFNTKCGGWGLYGRPGDTPAEFIRFKEKGRRRVVLINLNRIKPPYGTWSEAQP